MKFYCLPMEVVAYILGVILILINMGMVSFRIYIISNKQWAVDKAELVDGVEEKWGLIFLLTFLFFFIYFLRYRMAIFSFIVWENRMENFHNQIKMFGALDIIVNTLNAILAMLGVLGVYKKRPLLVFYSFFFPFYISSSGPHLGLWAWLLPRLLGLLDHHPRRLRH